MRLLLNKNGFIVIGVAALMGLAARPAMAEVHQIGAVNVANDKFTNISWEHFEGAVEELQFAAVGDTVDCAHISVTYRDGIVLYFDFHHPTLSAARKLAGMILDAMAAP